MIIFLRFRCFVIGFFVKIIRFILLDDIFLFFFFFIVRNFLNFEIKNRNFYLSILFLFEYSSSSSITILELYNRRKKFSSKDENSLWNSFHENFYLCLPSFIMRNAVSSYFSSARNELHPSFTGLRSDFFFFSILDACASQKHGISLSITILKLYIH